MRRRGRLAALGALVVTVVTAAAFTSAAQGVHAAKGPKAGPSAAACQLGDKGKIKHVIYLQFDNVHFQRDNPNVPSDLEQMPHLLNFLKDNGTFDTNDHTILISHTGGGILSSLTGLYPDRHGQAVSNSYDYFRPDGSVGFSSSFKYWTDTTDGGNAANSPPTPSGDTNYNMVNNDSAALGGTGAVRNAPGAVGSVHARRLRRRRRRAREHRAREQQRDRVPRPARRRPRGGRRGRRDEHQGRQRRRLSPVGKTIVDRDRTPNPSRRRSRPSARRRERYRHQPHGAAGEGARLRRHGQR